MNALKSRIERIEGSRNRGKREIVRVDPEAWEAMSPEELERHRADVRRAMSNPAAVLIVMADEGDPDPLAELLGPDDPAVIRNRGPGVTIARSYGMT